MAPTNWSPTPLKKKERKTGGKRWNASDGGSGVGDLWWEASDGKPLLGGVWWKASGVGPLVGPSGGASGWVPL